MCDYGSMVVEDTRLIIGAGGVAVEGSTRFSGEVIIAVDAFILGHVLNTLGAWPTSPIVAANFAPL
jgi:hypothetical protein